MTFVRGINLACRAPRRKQCRDLYPRLRVPGTIASEPMSQPYDNTPAPPYGPPNGPPYGPPRRPLPLPRKDEEHLDLLAILFYVYGAFVGLTALLFGGFALVGLALIPSAAGAGHQGSRNEPDPVILGVAFLIMFGAVALLFAAKAVVMFLAGRALGQRRGYVLAMVGACMALINMPIGTALGVFAIITLQKPEVKARLGLQ